MKYARKLVAAVGTAAAIAGTATVGLGTAGPAASAAAASAGILPPPSGSCALGNGVSHVIQITFDNVHFFRDNPNVQSDLEQMPNLLNFIKSNGTMLSNNHTPLIAHTAVDSLTNYTGLYGDRHGVGISNSYNSFNANPTKNADPATAFTYWTDPVDNTARPPSVGADANPNQVYSANVPATSTTPNKVAPAPWVPFTRAGCDVGDFSTANMVLENASYDIPKVFGSTSPEAAQTATDSDPFKDSEVADYVGVGVHCAKDLVGNNDSFCSTASGVKNGGTIATPTAIPDTLPDEPFGYPGYQALFGARYIAPQLVNGAGTGTDAGGNKVHTANGHSYVVANSAGNLVDLNGSQINGAFTSPPRPGFPGFSPSATQSLAYLADMQESGVPVTYGYISDVHEKKRGQTCSKLGQLGPGDPCYNTNAAAYDAAFGTLFQRLADDGITPSNSLFVFTADEGDHLNGANVGRATQPTCNTTVAPTTCSYTATQLGELNADLPQLFNLERGNTTQFVVEPQAGAVYVTGQPGPNDAAVRQLERDGARLTANNPYSGNRSETIANYLADPLEEQLLHYVNADPARTPSFTLFPKPDYYFGGNSGCTTVATCVTQNPSFLWNHGYYAPEINTTWLGLVGPGVAHKGVDGLDAPGGPGSAGPSSGQGTIPASGTTGTWADHTDIRPTLLALVGLKDDYTTDGRVLTEDLRRVPATAADPGFQPLAACYKQLNASVGRFGTSTLTAVTAAMTTGSAADDTTYTSFQSRLSNLATNRDTLATQLKIDLFNAEFNNTPLANAGSELSQCNAVLASADSLAASSGGAPPPGAGPQTPLVTVPSAGAASPSAGGLPWMLVVLGSILALVGERGRRRHTAGHCQGADRAVDERSTRAQPPAT